VTLVDLVAVAVILLAAVNGLRRGFVAGVFSLAGLAAGVYLGARIAPELLSDDESPYTPLVALGGAIVAAVVLSGVASLIGGATRSSLNAVPPLRALDSLGGLVLGAALGLALVWVAGAVALHLPGQTDLRRRVQSSEILRRLNREFPPQEVMDALVRVDPFAAITGPDANVAPPDPTILRHPGVQAAAGSVVRVTGTACGLGVQGSGWVARPDLVVTNAHVVAGVRDARLDRQDGRFAHAEVVSFDPVNDVAVLRANGLPGQPLRLADPKRGLSVVVLGYPENGPLKATPARIGQTARVITEDAYGRGPISRPVTTLRAPVRHGNSGGPAVDAQGRVRAVVFATRVGSEGGYAVPTDLVRRALDRIGPGTVSTGPCVR
jgi:S1-C subfamily serine protease